ncbi:MAG TPA: 50S ribosomal protein L18e [Candidatus Nanoarchaeia archaeon]|nr:50S ribosomal protein L18e [Candidatus Nanoarchaeia archaeon]
MKRTGPTSYQVQELLAVLEEKGKKSKLWQRVSEDIQKPTRQRRLVNVYKIEKYAQAGETVVVPGKVLSVGELTKKVDVAALLFSAEAKKKIEAAKGKVLSISELLQQNPEGKNVRILG